MTAQHDPGQVIILRPPPSELPNMLHEIMWLKCTVVDTGSNTFYGVVCELVGLMAH